jgi:hypothetical protein
MTVSRITQPVRTGLRVPVIWGLVVGVAQAASPLAFWWLDGRPSTRSVWSQSLRCTLASPLPMAAHAFSPPRVRLPLGSS